MHYLYRFSNNTQISSFIKIHQVEDKLFHADGETDGWTKRQTDRQTDKQTDMTTLRVTGRNFANAPTRGTETQKERKENKEQKEE